mmetsp:Transcript_39424/g.46060  ORF Transcript_39424/g.46060 Transcript_39424/m.46060 type:complete len:83 (-) Transcript_39424:368-616(-)
MTVLKVVRNPCSLFEKVLFLQPLGSALRTPSFQDDPPLNTSYRSVLSPTKMHTNVVRIQIQMTVAVPTKIPALGGIETRRSA